MVSVPVPGYIAADIYGSLSKYDLIAVDLLGGGDSDKPLGVSYAIKDHAELLQDIVTSLHIGKYHFAGQDLGGGMGQLFTVKYLKPLQTIVGQKAFLHFAKDLDNHKIDGYCATIV